MICNLGFPTRWAALLGAIAAVSTAGATPTLITAAVALPKAPPKMSSGLDPNALRFVPNNGQWDERAKFLAKTPGLNLWVTRSGLVYEFRRLLSNGTDPKVASFRLEGHAVGMNFVGASANSSQIGVGETPTTISYFTNNVSATNVNVYEEAKTVGLYDGIDLRTYIDEKSPRFDLIVKPGADPSQIRISFDGADGVALKNGQVMIGTRFGSRPMGDLKAYQIVNGVQSEVKVAFALNGNGELVFNVGAYDRSKELVIDPIVYSTLLGGTGGADIANNIVVDAFGAAYVSGGTNASTFPTTFGAFDETIAGVDGFVSKVTPDGTDLVWSTFIGGAGSDQAFTLGLDPLNNVYLAGTAGNGFPVTMAPAYGGGASDGFIAKLSANGASLLWARYIGGANGESFRKLTPDSGGNFFVGGTFPTAGLAAGSAFTTFRGSSDAYVAKVNGTTGSVTWSAYVGGTEPPPLSGGVDSFGDLDVDPAGNVYVAGTTNASDFGTFFTLAGNFDRSTNGSDAYLTKIKADGTVVLHGTMLGGNAGESGPVVAVDSDGFAYVATATTSFNYPITNGVFDTSYNNGTDWALTKVSQNGNTLIYSTFLGYGVGSGGPLTFTSALAFDVAVDDLGAVYLVGLMPNTQFPTLIPDQATYAGPTDANRFQGDAYLQVMGSSGSALLYSSFWGGARQDMAFSVALDGARNAYLTGRTVSGITDATGQTIVGFPTTPGAFKPNWVYDGPVPPPAAPGDESQPEGFVSKIKVRIPTVIESVVINPDLVAAGEGSSGVVTLAQPASTGGALVTIQSENTGVVQVNPTSVLIPEGGTTASFNITTNASITDKFVIKVTATVEGDSKFDTITVGPWLDSLTLSNATVVGGNPVGGRVNLIKPAPAGGVTVNLLTTDANVATVPATVTVPAGLNTATFVVDTTGVAVDTLVTISGSFAGTTRFKELTVKPAKLLSMTLNPSTVAGGSPSTGTINLDGDAPVGGLSVTLSKPGSPGDAFVTIPGVPVVVPAGERSVTFPITTTPAPTNTFCVIRATAGTISVDSTLTISNIQLFDFTISPNPVAGGAIVNGVVQLNQAAPPGGAVVDLTTADPNLASFVPGGQGNLVVTGPNTAQVTVPEGSAQVAFSIQSGTHLGPGNLTVDLTASRGGAPILRTLSISPIGFSVTIDPNNILGGQNSNMTITLTGQAPAGGVTFDVTKLSLLPNPPDNSGAVTVNGGNPITISGGLTSVTVPITTVGVSQTDTVQITATAQVSLVSGSANITVRAPKVIGIEFDPSVVRGLLSSNVIVTLDGPAPPGGVFVPLTELGPNTWIANTPVSVFVPGGQTAPPFIGTATVTTNKVSRTLGIQVRADFGGANSTATLFVTR